MFYQAANSYTHYFLWTDLHIVKPQSLFVESSSYNQATDNSFFSLGVQLICLMILFFPAPVTFCLWSHFYMIKAQCLQVESAADMLIQAAYSCTHYVLWIHLNMIKPQSLEVESAADMFNQAAYSCTHCFLFVESFLHDQTTICSGGECSRYV